MAVSLLNTKFSDIDLAFVKEYLQVEPEFVEDDRLIQLIMNSAKANVLVYTKMTIEELDANESVNLAYLKLIADGYDQRNATVNGKNDFDVLFNFAFNNVRIPTL